MKHVFLASAILAVSFPLTNLRAEDSAPQVGSIEQVACISAGTLAVRGDSLEQVLFQAQPGEPLKVFQGWGTTEKTKVVENESFTFRKVQFSDRADGQNIGWVADRFIQPAADCPFHEESVAAVASPLASTTASSGFRFPLKTRPTVSFTSGERAFGGIRDNGARRHAGADLYHSTNDPIVAVSSGRVLRDLYFFYQGTYALEVQHSNGMVVRYGEVTGRAAVRGGAKVAAGQTVGYMGKTSCCTPMLHFELYSGKSSGPLTTGSGSFQRRSDLLNPSSYLSQWETSTFGRIE